MEYDELTAGPFTTRKPMERSDLESLIRAFKAGEVDHDLDEVMAAVDEYVRDQSPTAG